MIKPMWTGLLVLAVGCVLPMPCPGAESNWPTVDRVAAQPLLLQTQRLEEALEYIGSPLPPGDVEKLRMLRREPDDKKVTAEIQAILDPLCVAAVRIGEGRLETTAVARRPELIQQGWRHHLVKVCNGAGLRSRLTVESPNARPLPHAKQEDVDSRWMAMTMFDGRPLQPNLSGLGLEYRIIQIYSRDAGEQQATLDFHVDLKDGKPGRVIREWRFDEGTDGWRAMNQVQMEASEGALQIKSTGNDPFIGADVGGVSGELLLRFRAATDEGGIIEVFWWTEGRPEPDGQRKINVPIIPGGSHQYEVSIPVQGVLAGIRIDPNVKPSAMRIDWIDLLHSRRQGENFSSVDLTFDAKPSIPVTLRIRDQPDRPVVAAFEIRDMRGRSYPEQTKRLAPDLFFHPQIYRRDGEIVHLPPGEYLVRCWRGPHSLPVTKQVVVHESPQAVEFQIQRWCDPTEDGWWSGDHHIHAAGCLHYVNPTEGVLPEHMLRQTMGEDLNVGCCLTWGPCFDYQKQFFTGAVDDVSQYPYLIRYDVEVSGFGSHASGHLNLLRLKEQIYPGGDSKHHWPTLGLNTLRWAKGQGAICGPAHSANGLTNYVGRLPGQDDGPNGLPHFNIPGFDGIGACEYVVDITHEVPGPDGIPVPAIDFISTMDTPRHDEWNMWYHTLNCGFRVRASGETDFPCMSGERVGIGRVYVNVPGQLNFEDWVQGIQDGRSYVSDGKAHLLDFQARTDAETDFLAVGDQGSELVAAGPTTIHCRAKCAVLLDPDQHRSASADPVEVELIVNGYPRATQTIVADGTLQDVTLQAEIDQSSWVALRVFPNAHTNPFFLTVDDQPIRASRASAEWFLACIDQCWKEKQPTYAIEEQQDARQAYDHARDVFQQILDECAQ
ncbi:hypothetical protein FYK55_26645 [Roseiconus nitratireducens]|uniref:Uncharacterized protein n=1 Tax=Roseiconus nitratireducens TaxID=2605748 RepID=A0A5M6D0L1_9BACT|nr:CehA/McbA family metallohydrolase [Roseiconus nitratireducens]KAA5538695.1 hypothetical protein FYK55_26645 [Roseiconus nitratireducens]